RRNRSCGKDRACLFIGKSRFSRCDPKKRCFFVVLLEQLCLLQAEAGVVDETPSPQHANRKASARDRPVCPFDAVADGEGWPVSEGPLLPEYEAETLVRG